LRSLRSSAPSGSSSRSAGECDPLLLPARQLIGPAILEAVQPHGLDHVAQACRDLSTAELLDLGPEGDVLRHGHVREQAVGLEHHVHVAFRGRDVRHVGALQQDPALVRSLEAGDHAQRRRLAAATRAEHREELATGNRDRHVVDGGDVVESLRDGLDEDLAGSIAGLRCGLVRTHVWILFSRPNQ
jgi:hypothetical protein